MIKSGTVSSFIPLPVLDPEVLHMGSRKKKCCKKYKKGKQCKRCPKHIMSPFKRFEA